MNNNTNTQQDFVWTDELVKEFANFYKSKQGVDFTTWGKCIMDSFKKSKQQHTIEGDKRVKMIKAYDKFGGGIKFEADIVGNITNTQISAIRNFMEKTLNNEVDNPVLERQPQEVKEPNKDWEVLEVVDFRRGVIKVGKGTLFNYVDGEPIHSVRRISDNCVFSVGDKCSYGKVGNISKFTISAVGEMLCDIDFSSSHGYQNAPLRAIEKPLTKEEEPKPVRLSRIKKGDIFCGGEVIDIKYGGQSDIEITTKPI